MNAEARKPPSNQAPAAGVAGKLKQALLHFLDLQTSTVIADVRPWLQTRRTSILEVGCGNQPYRHFLPADCKYSGLEWAQAVDEFAMPSRVPDVTYYSGDRFPFADASYENVFHTEVLEHVMDYRTFLAECRRVLKPGGSLMFSIPFQARFHFIPHDYWRFTPSGLKTILEDAGFGEITVKPRGTDITMVFYKAVSVFYRWAYGGLVGKLVFIAFAPSILAMLLIAHATIRLGLGSDDDCLGYTVTAIAPPRA